MKLCFYYKQLPNSEEL